MTDIASETIVIVKTIHCSDQWGLAILEVTDRVQKVRAVLSNTLQEKVSILL